jgi:hypothetical protein
VFETNWGNIHVAINYFLLDLVILIKTSTEVPVSGNGTFVMQEVRVSESQ